jgi:hypothetical protein
LAGWRGTRPQCRSIFDVTAEDDEVEIVLNFALNFERLESCPHMQDWEWEVADSERINEFPSAYESGELSDDERFTLMETILQSFEDLQLFDDRAYPD